MGHHESLTRTIRRTIKYHKNDILTIPGVNYITIGKKIIGNEITKELAIKIYVNKKYNASGKYSIPSRYKAIGPHGEKFPFYIATDVIEDKEQFTSLSLQGGDNIQRSTRGSIGIAYTNLDGNQFILTNSHVIAKPGTTSFNKDVYDSVSNKIGTVARLTKINKQAINYFDGALITPTSSVDLYQVKNLNQYVSKYGRFNTNSNKKYFYISGGRKITCKYPELVNTPIEIVFSKFHSAYFENFIKLEIQSGTPRRSHSGSALLQFIGGELAICGLVFSGNTSTLGVIPIRNILNALGKSKAGNGIQENCNIRF